MANQKDFDVESKLKELAKQLDRNEELMRVAAIHYEDLVAAKEDLVSNMASLKKSQVQKKATLTRG